MLPAGDKAVTQPRRGDPNAFGNFRQSAILGRDFKCQKGRRDWISYFLLRITSFGFYTLSLDWLSKNLQATVVFVSSLCCFVLVNLPQPTHIYLISFKLLANRVSVSSLLS